MYAYKNQIGTTIVSVELPDYISDYIEFDGFPETGGIPYIIDGELIFAPAPTEQKQDETPEQSNGKYDAFLEGLMEGYQNG